MSLRLTSTRICTAPYQRIAFCFAGILSLLLLLTPGLAAQGFGSIQGTVSDPSGALIPGAKVVATAINTGQTNTVPSNQSGRFVFPQLLPTQYSISVAPALLPINRTASLCRRTSRSH